MKRKGQEDEFSAEYVLEMYSSMEERELVSLLIDQTQSSVHSDYEQAEDADPRYRALLLYLERNLTNPDISISSARVSSRLDGVNTYASHFSRITGMGPRAYLEHHRFELARNILRHTNVDVHVVAFTVGFNDPNHFSKNYKRVVGYAPSNELKVDVSETAALFEDLRANREEREQKQIDPRASAHTAEVSAERPISDMETFWELIMELDRADIKKTMLIHIGSIDINCVRFLLEKSKFEGRRDRRRGEELTYVALDTLNLVEFSEGVQYLDDRAMVFANLGNAARLRFNFVESREWFKLAERLLPCEDSDRPLLQARVRFLKVSLLWWQKNTEDARKLLQEVLPVIRIHGSKQLLARALLLDADIHDHTGHPDRAIPLISEALDLAEFVDDPYVIFSGYFNLTQLYARSGMIDEAIPLFKIAKRRFDDLEGGILKFHMAYLEGLVIYSGGDNLKKAESLFVEAKEGFLNCDLDIYAALVSLYLSMLYLDLGKPDRACIEAIGAIPSISRFRGHEEAIRALAILQEVEKTQEVSKPILKQVLHHLEMVRKDPAFSPA